MQAVALFEILRLKNGKVKIPMKDFFTHTSYATLYHFTQGNLGPDIKSMTEKGFKLGKETLPINTETLIPTVDKIFEVMNKTIELKKRLETSTHRE